MFSAERVNAVFTHGQCARTSCSYARLSRPQRFAIPTELSRLYYYCVCNLAPVSSDIPTLRAQLRPYMELPLSQENWVHGSFTTKSCKSLLGHVCLSVCLSSCNNSITLNESSLKLLIVSFTEICGHIPVLVKFGQQQWTLDVKTYPRSHLERKSQIKMFQVEAVDKNEACTVSAAQIPCPR
jgi:hypothetical protein